MGRIRQIVRAYQLTHEHDKALPLVLLGAFLLPIVLAVVIGLAWDHLVYLIFMGVMVGLLAMMSCWSGGPRPPPSSGTPVRPVRPRSALQMLPKQWISTPVIAANRSRDVVHRTLGPGGLVLIGEGEPGRVRQLLASEVKKHERVAYGRRR